MTAPNTETTSLKQQLGHGAADGQVIAPSGGKVAFFGSTPVVQQTGDTSITTTGMNTGTSGIFTSTTKSQAFITAVMNIQTALKNLGLTT